MKATLGCMRISISRGLVLCGVAVLLMVTLSLAGGPARAAESVVSPEAASPAALQKATYDETQPGADDPRVKEGFAVYQAGDFKKAYAIWLPLAEAGNAEAQFRIGRLYHVGEGLNKDGEAAAQWYQYAILAGHVSAAYNLGKMYRRGNIIPYDFAKAIKYYTIAAESSDIDAQFSLGIAYAIAPLPDRNFTEAYKWFYIAQKNGDAGASDAIRNLDKFATTEQKIKGIDGMREWFIVHPRNP